MWVFLIMKYYQNLKIQNIKYFCELDLVWKIEVFKDIPEYIGQYQISDLGRVKSLNRIVFYKTGRDTRIKEKILSINTSSKYYFITLRNNKKPKSHYIHHLVAMVFMNHIPNNKKEEIDHIDNDKKNNSRFNLQIISKQHNTSKDKTNKTSKYYGVCKRKSTGKYIAYALVNGKQKTIGNFKNELDAHTELMKFYNENISQMPEFIKNI